MVSIGFYELYLSPCIAKSWRQKVINSFVSETIESACIIIIITSSLAQWVECSPMIRETWVQSQVASYQRFLKWYLVPPCLTLSNIRYVSRVKWSNPRKGVAPSSTPRCSSYWKGSLLVALDYGRQLTLLLLVLRSSCLYNTALR